MSTTMGTESFLVNFEPFFVIFGMTSVATVLTPYYKSFTESPLTNNTEKIAFAVSFGSVAFA